MHASCIRTSEFKDSSDIVVSADRILASGATRFSEHPGMTTLRFLSSLPISKGDIARKYPASEVLASEREFISYGEILNLQTKF